MTIDSLHIAKNPGSHEHANRDNSRDIPVNASRDVDPARLASLALDVVSDHYRIHRRCFDDRPRGPGAVGRARQVAVALVLRAGVDEWPASQAFAIDLSTVKAARDRVAMRERDEDGFAANFLDLQSQLAEKLRGDHV